jgi:AcrR family transcriptional regulator
LAEGQKKVDRRAARTRRHLHEALFRVVQQMSYDEATVQDILDEADVGRSTFYAHFAGKDDLLRSGFEALRDELRAIQNTAFSEPGERGAPLFAFSSALFAHACAHGHIYRALIGSRGSALVVTELQRIVAELVRRDLTTATVAGDQPTEMLAQFAVATFHTVLKCGLERKADMPPLDMDAAFRRLVMNGLGLPRTAVR